MKAAMPVVIGIAIGAAAMAGGVLMGRGRPESSCPDVYAVASAVDACLRLGPPCKDLDRNVSASCLLERADAVSAEVMQGRIEQSEGIQL